MTTSYLARLIAVSALALAMVSCGEGESSPSATARDPSAASPTSAKPTDQMPSAAPSEQDCNENGECMPPGRFPPMPGFDEPCPGAPSTVYSREELENRPDVWLPTDGTARVVSAWSCEGDADTAVLFDNGVKLLFETGWNPKLAEDPDAALREFQDGRGEIQTILDRPALVQPVDDLSSLSQILLFIDTVLVRALAQPDTSIDEMTELLEQLDTEGG